MIGSLPTGTVTFLLTDIESSTVGWEADRSAMAAAVARHYELLDAAISDAGGVRPVEQGEGDSVVAAFSRATDAVRAAVAIQRALATEPWADGAAVAVRIALHTGEAELRDEGNYFGPAIIRCARLRSLAHGGQTVCSRATADLVSDALPDGLTLQDLGTHQLKDLARPEQVFGLLHPELPAEFPPLRSASRRLTLPVALTSFVGREKELVDLLGLVGTHRLVTLTGSGGVGKTRLAVRVAAELTDRHRDGVWFVDLAPVVDPDLLAEVVLTVLGVPDAAGSTAAQRLLSYLSERHLLLVLDNCEHLVEGCAELLAPLLRACPGLWVVATSREGLSLPGEFVWQVPSMGADGVALFVERAVEARPNFAPADTGVLEEICDRLDGIPLAIELAAARSRVLSPEQILVELKDRFRLLTGRSRGALGRQQTLEASVAWSHGLLSDAERTLFRRLAVFSGAFGLDAAEAVAAGEGLDGGAVLDVLEALVAKSMVSVIDDRNTAGSRYRLLETMRAFAARELDLAAETAAVRDAHLAYYVGLLRAADRDLAGINLAVMRRLTADADNYRTAIDWALSGDDGDAAAAMAMRWGLVCIFRGRYREGEQAAARTLAVPQLSLDSRIEVLWTRAGAQLCMVDLPGLTATSAEAMSLAEEGGPSVQLKAHHTRVFLQQFVDPRGALVSIEATRELSAIVGVDSPIDAGVLMDLEINRLFVLMRSDDLSGAADAVARAKTVIATFGNEFLGSWGHAYEAMIWLRCGELGKARAAATLGKRMARGLDEVQVVAVCDAAMARAALCGGDAKEALAQAERAIPACAEAGGFTTLAYLMTLRGQALAALGQDDDARAALTEALDAATRLQDPWQQAQAALALAGLLARVGSPAGVPDLLAVARACGEHVGSPWVGAVADHVSALASPDLGQAEDLHHAALAVHVAQGYAFDVVDVLEVLAGMAADQESWSEAVRLLGATTRRREELGYRHGVRAAEQTLDAARAALGPDAFAAALADGGALSIDAAVAYATRARGERGRPSFGWASLTPTEAEVARLAARGASNPDIARALFVSPNTVKTHLSHIYAKLGLTNRTELAAELARRGG